MDLFHDSPLFALIYYKLWIFNYKYCVVAVVRPQSCLHLLLAIQVIPSQLLSLLSYYTLLWITEPLNHWTLASTATMLMLSIPRPCKVLTNVATCVTSTQSITASWTLLNNFGVQQNFDTAQPPGQPQSWQWRSWKRIPWRGPSPPDSKVSICSSHSSCTVPVSAVSEVESGLRGEALKHWPLLPSGFHCHRCPVPSMYQD